MKSIGVVLGVGGLVSVGLLASFLMGRWTVQSQMAGLNVEEAVLEW